MRNRHKNLNEQIIRMKSLFTEERLYGNLVETVLKTKTLITEQGGKRRVFQNLKRAFSLGLKSIDPKILTNFLNFKIVDLGDFAKHLDEYYNVWVGSIIPAHVNFKGMKDLVKEIDVKIKTDPEWIKKIPYEKWVSIAKMFPKEGGVQETVINLMLEAAGKTTKTIDDVNIGKIDIVKSGDEVVITTTKGNEVKQYKKNSSTEFVDVKDGNTVYRDDAMNPVNQKSTDEVLTDINTSLSKETSVIKDVPEGATMKEMDGKVYDDTPKNNEKVDETVKETLENEGGIYMSKSESNNELIEQQLAESKEIIKELETKLKRNEDQATLANQIELKRLDNENKKLEYKIEKEKTKQKELEKKKEKPTKTEGEGTITPEQVGWIKRKWRELTGDSGEFWDKYIGRVLFLRNRPKDNQVIRLFKITGSSIVDPLGFLKFFNTRYNLKTDPKNLNKAISNYAINNRVVRMIYGSGVNVVFWNFVMWKLYEDENYALKFSGKNIFKTYWNNIKSSWPAQAAKSVAGYYWDQVKMTCEDIEKESGKTCDEWLNGWRDELPRLTDNYIGEKSCAELKNMLNDDGTVKESEVKKLAKYCHNTYNEEMEASYPVGVIEGVVRYFTDYEGPITGIAEEAFLTVGIGDTEQDSLADLIKERQINKCREEFLNSVNKNEESVEETEVILVETDSTQNQIKL